jgi:diacylglycerol kinase (ATP)
VQIRIILNLAAGTAGKKVQALQALMDGRTDVRILESRERGHAQLLAAEAASEGCDLVIAAGGDGTIHEVVQGLASVRGRTRLGVLPFGTGNDLARTLGIPDDPAAAVALLEGGGVEREVDLFRVESAGEVRYGINVAAGGFSGQVDEVLTDEMKATWGPLAYVRGALGVLPDLTAYDTRIAWDDGEPERVQALNIVVANGKTCGGGTRVAPAADISDGLLDVVVVRHGSLLDLAKIAARLIAGDYTESDGVDVRRARRVHVASRPGMWFNVDGELLGNQPVSFEVIPGALRVIAGPAEAVRPPPPPDVVMAGLI